MTSSTVSLAQSDKDLSNNSYTETIHNTLSSGIDVKRLTTSKGTISQFLLTMKPLTFLINLFELRTEYYCGQFRLRN